MVKVIWTDQAIQDFIDIGEFIANESGRYAREIVGSLFESVNIFETYSGTSRIVPEYNLKNLRELIRGNCRIVYRIVDNKGIDIFTIHLI